MVTRKKLQFNFASLALFLFAVLVLVVCVFVNYKDTYGYNSYSQVYERVLDDGFANSFLYKIGTKKDFFKVSFT